MLPLDWKKEIQEIAGETAIRNVESETRRIAGEIASYRSEERDRERGKRCREVVTIVGLFVTAIFTIAIAAAGVAQTWAFIQSEKSFVFPVGADFTGPLVPLIQRFNLYVEFKNSGKSPASIEELNAVISHELSPKPQYGPGINHLTVAFSPITGGEQRKQTLDFGTGWPEATDAAVKAGTMKMFIYGLLKYRDDYSFFGPRESQFCFVYIPTDAVGGHLFRNCPQPAYTYTR